jgi:putative tryptophan/tyrosine transport system substrate-binding protein
VVIGRRTLLGGALAAAVLPRTAGAQSGARVLRLGVLLFSDPGSDPNFRDFREGMRELGYVEGQNLSIDYRYAEGQPDRLPELAADVVRARPDVIFVLGGDVAPFAKRATHTIPIVFSSSADPVRAGLVPSLARPGGNLTGVTFITSDLAGKRLQFLREAAPRTSRVAVLWNPDHLEDEFRETQAAAGPLGVQILSCEVRTTSDFEQAFQSAAAWKADGVSVIPSRATVRHRVAIVEFATKQRLALAGGWGLWAESGALLSYGPDVNVMVRRAAGYVDRIVKGAKPADLPVEQPTKFELVVNLRTARALALTMPQSLLLRADRVIQ